MGPGIPGRRRSQGKGPEVGVRFVWLWSNEGAGMGDSGDQGRGIGAVQGAPHRLCRGLTFRTCKMAARGLLYGGGPLWDVRL